MAIFRDYEVSVWTLQDEFITVLKPSGMENKNHLNEPDMKLNVDGTQEFTFSIPMYIYEGTERIENPIWYNTRNGVIIASLRKIKVIFPRANDKPRIFELLITKVEEKHSNDTLYCDVTCEGLAFHELGKVGYKVSLSADLFYEEDFAAFEDTSSDPPPAPVANINWWLDKFLEEWDENKVHHLNQWYYVIDMDWSAYSYDADNSARLHNKIYEEPYVASWEISGDKIVPKSGSITEAKEKERMIEAEESNHYNLTQTIAETFGVFCRYEYEHDESYHIIARKVIFYNNFMREKEGYINITYPYVTSEVTREMDSTDLITKMFVKSVDNDNTASGWSTIVNSDANKTKEDYIMNFDYLRTVGAISDDQYDEIAVYEKRMRGYNDSLIYLETVIRQLEEQLPEAEAKLTIAKNAIQLDNEQLSKTSDLLKALDGKDGDVNGTITIGPNNPKSAVLLQDKNNNSLLDSEQFYYINLTEKGILAETVQIYKTLKYAAQHVEERLADNITNFKFEYDETNCPIKIINIPKAALSSSKIVYLTYQYTPKTYYQEVENIWSNRLAKDEADKVKYENLVNGLNEQITQWKESYKNFKTNKEIIQKSFYNWFGGAIREGYWQPEDYNDYGDVYNDAFKASTNSAGNSGHTKFIWDNNLFDDEQDIQYKITASQNKQYYPCIDLSNYKDLVAAHLDELSLLFYDHAESSEENGHHHTENEYRIFSLGSKCQLAYLKRGNNNPIPILIITGAEELSNDIINDFMKKTARLGSMTTTYTPGSSTVDYTVANWTTNILPHGISNTVWLTLNDNTDKVVYPRIQIDSLSLKTSSDQLALKYNNNVLKDFEDYYILPKSYNTDDYNPNNSLFSTYQDYYYITLKPTSLAAHGWEGGDILLKFALSNADTAIYLDALKVLKENAFPKVSYTVTPSAIDKNFLIDLYDKLARVANIIDNDLKFNNVQGYISEVNLNLNQPWNDSVEIKNYKTKFEDLFTNIVAQTEAMKSNEHIIDAAASLMVNGEIAPDVLQNSLRRVDLDYAFNNGTLTIDEKEGIWGTSDSGVVAFRGGGIFTATQKDKDGNWIWNTGIVPQGINADLITTGQLDTNLIRIYSGDDIKFQWNDKGLYAYKSFLRDENLLTLYKDENITVKNYINDNEYEDIDAKQYAVFNEDGLFLIAEEGALIANDDGTDFIRVGDDVDPECPLINKQLKRVEVSWDGFKLRNWGNREVFYADPDTGNLTLDGTIYARNLYIGGDYGGEPGASFDSLTKTGRNLLLNSSNNYAMPYSNTLFSSMSRVNLDDLDCRDAFRIQGKVVNNRIIALINQSSHGLSSIAGYIDNYAKYRYIKNQTYTLSMYIKNNSATKKLFIRVNGSPQNQEEEILPDTDGTAKPIFWKRTVTFTGESSNNSYIQINFLSESDTADEEFDFTYWHPKIEFGDIATQWSAAPEDFIDNNYSATPPTNPKIGDEWYCTTNYTENNKSYFANMIYVWTGSDWIVKGRVVKGTALEVDTDNGNINILANHQLTLATNGLLSIIGAQGVAIGSNSQVTFAASNNDTSMILNNNGINIHTGGTFKISSNNFVVTMDKNNQYLTRFALGSNLLAINTENQNPLIDLVREGSEYSLTLSGNIAASLPASLTAVASKFAWTSNWVNNVPLFNEADNYPLGTLGIAYTALSGSAGTSEVIGGQFNGNDSNYLPTAAYNVAGHQTNRFGLSASFWNVSRGAKDTFTSDQWSRAGHYSSDLATCITYVPIYLTSGSNPEFHFTWRITPAEQSKIGWSCYNTNGSDDFANHVWVGHDLTFALYSSTSSRLGSTKVSLGNAETRKNYSYSGSVQINNCTIQQPGTYYLVIYDQDNEPFTLRFFDQTSFYVGGGSSITDGKIGIYIKTALGSNETWKELITTSYSSSSSLITTPVSIPPSENNT